MDLGGNFYMQHVVETGLTKPAAPHSWAIASNNTLYSVHVPIRPDGSIENGDATRQTQITLEDLRTTLNAAGADLKDVSLVQIYLTSLTHKPVVDEVYKRFFNEPYPVRACVAVSELPTPGTMIEIVAVATIPSAASV
jgi:enamine deaminase RidA (YjgF/YER057c/UK114 family)